MRSLLQYGLLVWAFLSSCVAEAVISGDSSPPNIIFLVCESTDGRTWRRGYQDDVIPLPNIRKLEDEGGVSFYRHYSNAPVCCPSRATFWSGKHAHKIPHRQNHNGNNNDPVDVHGVWNNFEGLPPGYNQTIFHVLQRHGYATFKSGKEDYTAGAHSFDARVQAFTMYTQFPYDIPQNGGWAEEGNVCKINGTVIEEDDGKESNYWRGDWDSVHETIEWIQNHTNSEVGATTRQPFFAYQGMNIVHPAYVTNKRYYDSIDPEKIAVPEWIPPEDMHPCDLQSTMLKGCFPPSPDTNASFYDKERRRRIRRIYYAMISEFDAMVGAYVDAVRTKLPKDVADNTIFILTSDHGDMQMEHQQHYKQVPYDASSSVPMVIYDPRRKNDGTSQALRNQVVRNPTQLIDIYPTIMELAQVPSRWIPADLDGQSLLPLMDGESTQATNGIENKSVTSLSNEERPNYVVSQYHGDKTAMSWFLIVEPMPCVAGGSIPRLRYQGITKATSECTMKYVVWGTGSEVDSMLFDLTKDPDEHTNLIHDPNYSTIVQTLDRHLKSVVDYEIVALDVARYNQQSFQHWINATENWRDVLADEKLRWHRSWEAAGTEQAIEVIEEWLEQEPQVYGCRASLVGHFDRLKLL